jgi:ubiquinone/menaquinone biosynthesis C-methylase UbiE
MSGNIKGDVDAFDANWKARQETDYTHWVRGDVKNQIQLAFRNHWSLFRDLMSNEPLYSGGKRVMEIGCGRGSLSCYFSDAGYKCTLVDLSKSVLETAKKIFSTNQLDAEFVIGDANSLDIPDKSFDVIYSIGLLEHFDDIETPLKEQIRVLDDGGIWFGYIVPKYKNNVQTEFSWINDILEGYHEKNDTAPVNKQKIFRSDYGSKRYTSILKQLGLKNIQASGVYPLPMISHSIDFPFSLMPDRSEHQLVRHFEKVLAERKTKNGTHPWLCDEGYGNAFLVWGVK